MGYIDSTSAVCIYLCGGISGCVGNLMIGGRISLYKNLVQKNQHILASASKLNKLLDYRERRERQKIQAEKSRLECE